MQDRTDGKSSGYNISYGIGIGEHAVMRNGTKEMTDGLHTTNIGVGYSRGKHIERTTNAIGGFTAEHGVLDVIGKTVQTGSVIGGGFTLNTGTYEKNDLEDVNKRKNVGINLTFTPGVTDVYRNGKLTPDSVGGVLVGTRIDYSKDDYVAKVKATIGNSVNMTVAGKKADLSGVNRDTSNMVDVVKDRKINPVSIDLGTEYWATNYGREKTKGDFVKAGNKIERVVEIIKAVSENEGKDIGLYYRDRLDFEAERDRKERSGELETILIDRDKALEMAERAAGRKIDDLQIISMKEPNIKEIVGADAIAGRAYHVGNGKIVIVADNIGDYAKAMGTIAEEGRHIYHRKNNGLEDSEDYASFYGRQFERYYDRNFGNNDVAFITERLKYTKEQLGNDWENKSYGRVIDLKKDRYKNYSGKALDMKIMSDYKLTEAEYYEKKAKLKEGGAVGWYDGVLWVGGFIKDISPAVTVIATIDITQKWLRGVGTDDRAAYLVALSYEKVRFEKAAEIAGWENRFIGHIGNLGARTKEEKTIVTFSNDPLEKFEHLPKRKEFLSILERGIEKYNADKTKKPIKLSDLIAMKKRQERYMQGSFDPDVYLKPYTLERRW
jgi:putative uncharacterized protein (fragment)